MATQALTYTFASLCDKPACMCEGSTVWMFLRGTTLMTDGKPAVEGQVASIVQNEDGSVAVEITYNDSTLPEGFTVIAPTTDDDGTVCPPDCISECSWLWKAKKLVSSGSETSILNRTYQLAESDEHIADGTWDLPRIPFDRGLRLSDVKLTCSRYDEHTSATITVKLNEAIVASYSGILGAAQSLHIFIQDLDLDDQLQVIISNTAADVYEDGALGPVIELVGVLPAP